MPEDEDVKDASVAAAGAGAERTLGRRTDPRARPARMSAALLPEADAHAAAKAARVPLTTRASAKASRSAAATFDGEAPKTLATAAFVVSMESVTTTDEPTCRPRRRTRAFMALLPLMKSPAGSLMRPTTEKADVAFATASSEAHAARSCTPRDGVRTKSSGEPPGTTTPNMTEPAAGAGRGEAERDAVGVRDGVGVALRDAVDEGVGVPVCDGVADSEAVVDGVAVCVGEGVALSEAVGDGDAVCVGDGV